MRFMLNLLHTLAKLNAALAGKARSITAYDEALALYNSGDYGKALPLMTEAAELGNTQAMSILGSMYLLGQGVKEDGRLAVQWLRSALEGGYVEAGSVLGMAYATGKAGVKRNLPKARMLLEAAASRGDAQSARMLEMMHKGEGMFAAPPNGQQRYHR